jgi:hypothetical protein
LPRFGRVRLIPNHFNQVFLFWKIPFQTPSRKNEFIRHNGDVPIPISRSALASGTIGINAGLHIRTVIADEDNKRALAPARVGKSVDFSIHTFQRAFHPKLQMSLFNDAMQTLNDWNGKCCAKASPYRGRPSATSFSRSSSRYSCMIR